MKIVERKFEAEGQPWPGGRLARHTWMVCTRSKKMFGLCDEAFAEVFNVPPEVKTIWLSLHDRPAANRAVVNVEIYNDVEIDYGNDGSYPEMQLLEYEPIIYFSSKLLDSILKPLVGKTVYLQCEYEV